jgi:tetratricopeptide (TPR) repeat protein
MRLKARCLIAPLVDWLRSEACRIAISRLDKIWLVEIARLMPELLAEGQEVPAPQPLTETWQRQKFYQALAQAILGMRQPLLLILDDLQWCDPELLEWLHYLLRAEPRARFMLIGTTRAEGLVTNQALETLLTDLRGNDKLTEIVLEQLDEAETAKLAGHTAGFELESSMARRLFHETEGNPLFIIETVRAGYLAKATRSKMRTETWSEPATETLDPKWLPEKVRLLIAGRLAQLSAPARRLAGLAATIGRSFSVDILVQASEANEDELLGWLDELWQRRIVHVLDENTYDFTHDKLRQVAYSEASLPRRRLLHLRVARALESLHASNIDRFSGQLAVHYDQAGKTKQAIQYYYQAAQVAQGINANQEAAGLLGRALALIETLPEGRERDLRELDINTALVVSLYNTLGAGAPEVIHTFDRVLALSERLEESPNPPILRGLAINHICKAKHNQAFEFSKQLVQLAERKNDPLFMVEANYAVGVTRFWLGNFQPARDYLEKAIALYNPQDARSYISLYGQNPYVSCLARLGLCLWCLGYPQQAVEASQRALQHAQELAHPRSLAYAIFSNVILLAHLRMFHLASERVQVLIDLSKQNQMRRFLHGSTVLEGWLQAEQGEIETGIEVMQEGMEHLRAGGAEYMRPMFFFSAGSVFGQTRKFTASSGPARRSPPVGGEER